MVLRGIVNSNLQNTKGKSACRRFRERCRARTILLFFAAGGVLCTTAAADKMSTGDAKTDGAMVEVQEKLKGVKTCQARVRTVLRLEGEQFEIVDDLSVQVPSKLHLDRVLAGQINQTVVSDGSLLWRYDLEERMVSRINVVRVYRATNVEADADLPNPARPFRALVWKSIRYAGTESINGEDLRVFEARPEVTLLYTDLPEPPARVRLYVHPGDGLLRTVRFYGASGEEFLSQHFEAVKVNPKLKESLFEFVVPAGVHVMDITDDVIASLNAAKQEQASEKGQAREKQ